jgi:hypothetical protein
MPTRSASCKASAPDLIDYPVSSNSLLDLTPTTPAARRLSGMEARHDVDGIALEAVVESVGEPREKCSPETHRNLRKRLSQCYDEIHDLFEGTREGIAKARTPGFVPVSGQRYVSGRLRAEADSHS